MASTTVMAALVVAVIYTLLYFIFVVTQDPREPPVVDNSIPFISPIIGMIRHKTLYYNKLRKAGNVLPIYTLRLPNVRAYIINATELIPVLQRQWRTISFTPIMASAGQAALGMSQAGGDILRRDITSDTNTVVGLVPLVTRAMAPGPALDSMIRNAIKVMDASINQLEGSQGTPVKINLYEWTCREIHLATTEAVFGPKNPYRDPAVAAAWRIFEPGYLALALSPLKPLTAPEGLRARELLTSAFVSYLENNGPETASEFIKTAHAHHVSHGFITGDLARFEVGHTHAISGSTAPSAWWLLWHVYSDPTVLREVRAELDALVVESAPDIDSHSEGGEKRMTTKTLDLALLATPRHAPVIHSTLKEALRVRTIATAVRLCLEDHLLQGKYLLKKGALVIVPQPLHHASTSAWGDDAEQFDHRRFVRPRSTTGQKTDASKNKHANKKWKKGYDGAAFRAFGGGHTLCPGRHFSTSEILAFAAMMVLRFDLVPTKGGKWAEPTWAKTHMVASLQIPDEDVEVEIRPRDTIKTHWRFVGPGKTDE